MPRSLSITRNHQKSLDGQPRSENADKRPHPKTAWLVFAGIALVFIPQAIVALTIFTGHSDQQVNVLSATNGLISAVLWPGILLYTLFLFEPQFRTLLERFGHGDISVKAAGLEFKLKTAALALSAASAKQPDEEVTPDKAAGVLNQAVPNEASLQELGNASVLWVDDRPQNNRFERSALQQLGVTVDLSTSTDDALKRLSLDSYDLIISDMGRPPDDRAGYTLLDALRKRQNQTPFLIYAGSRSPQHIAEAVAHGAIGCTNRPAELMTLATEAILRRV